MRITLCTFLVLSANILLSQVNSFPYTESFEQSFNTGSNIEFIAHWKGNVVATRNRIFAGSDPRSGEQSLNIIPTSSFKGTIEVSMNLSNVINPKLSFYAFSKQNGSSSSNRPTLLKISTSVDGGLTFTDDSAIGDETTFPNNDSTVYSLYTYELPTEASGQENVIIRLIAERGSGSGSAAELVMDDFSIESQILPLQIVSAEAISKQSVQLHFNQAIVKASAENIQNYSLSDNISVKRVELITSNSVLIHTDTLVNGQYEIRAWNIEDSFSQTPSDTLVNSFTFIEELKVVEVSVVDKRTLELEFNLALDSVSSRALEYYQISPAIGAPLVISSISSSKMRLSLGSDLQDETYSITINGVKDKSTLALVQGLTASFTYLPLKVTEINPLSSTEIALKFNQQIEPKSAALPINYAFNFGLAPIYISPSDSVVNIKLNQALANNTYSITLNNISNLIRNAQTEDLRVEFKYETATQPRQIVINEIFADPSGDHEPNPVSLPNDSNNEFVELYNNSIRAINIGGFQLSGGKIQDYVLMPNSYVILTANSNINEFSPFGNVVGVTSWNSLSNNGESITLVDNLGNLVDSLSYDKSWYKDVDKSDGGWSIEQINPTPSCIGSHNWSSSVDPKGGTPGQQNSIYDLRPDQSAPTIIAHNIVNDSTLQLLFSEDMNVSTLVENNFTLSEGLAISKIDLMNVKGTEVQIGLTSPFQYGFVHSLTVSNVTDCPGNKIQPTVLEFYRGATPLLDEIIITEIMAAPSPTQGLPEAEYLELYNKSNKIISLNNLTIADKTSSTQLLEFNLYPNDYVILTPNSTSAEFNLYGNVLGVSNWISLNNSEDRISIFDQEGELITSTNYSKDWYRDTEKSDGGYSLEMIDTSFPCLEEQNWTASQNDLGGTPGKVNSVNDRNPDLLGPRLLQAVAIDKSTIQLYFDEKLNTSGIRPDNFSGNFGLSFIAITIDENQRSILLTTMEDLVENTVYTIEVGGITDCSGNLIRENFNAIELIVSSKAEQNDIVINEILFNPRAGGVRFVEMYNQSNKYINLKNWHINGSSNSRVIAEHNSFMAPNDFALITNNAMILLAQYPNTIAETIIEINSMPSLSSSEGQIVIKSAEGLKIDSLYYSEDYHSPLISDTEGVSLERISYSAPSDDSNNWFSASSTEYSATPGYENSQSRQVRERDGEIVISPLAFAPESTQSDNFTTINYSFETPGNILNPKVIDSNGNLVKDLGQNIVAGKTGFLIWDGTTDNLGKAPVGYYMVLIEIISPEGNIRYAKNKVAIATRF